MHHICSYVISAQAPYGAALRKDLPKKDFPKEGTCGTGGLKQKTCPRQIRWDRRKSCGATRLDASRAHSVPYHHTASFDHGGNSVAPTKIRSNPFGLPSRAHSSTPPAPRSHHPRLSPAFKRRLLFSFNGFTHHSKRRSDCQIVFSESTRMPSAFLQLCGHWKGPYGPFH